MDQEPTPIAEASQAPETLTLASSSSDPLSPATLFTSPSDLCYDLSSLQDLAGRGQWRSVADKVARARSLNLLSKPHEHLIYLAFNALALFKLRSFSSSSLEIETLISSDSALDPFDSPNTGTKPIPIRTRTGPDQCCLSSYVTSMPSSPSTSITVRRPWIACTLFSISFGLGSVMDPTPIAGNGGKYEECIERDPGDVVAVNNKALCLMYLRDLSDSIKLLEGALQRVPTAAVNEMAVKREAAGRRKDRGFQF